MESKPITEKAQGEFEVGDAQLPPEIAAQQQNLQAQTQEVQQSNVDNLSTVASVVDNLTTTAQPKETGPQISFRQLREAKEKAERERDYLLNMMNQKQTEQVQPQVQEEPDFMVEQDGLVEGKHLSKLQKQLKDVKNQLKQYQQQTEVSVVEAKIRAVCPDFDKVCTMENITALREMDPELAATINTSNDLYNKAIAAYKAIKRYNIGVQDNFVDDKLRVQKNASKPKPMASLAPHAESPLAQANAFANGLTDDLKKNLYKEMMELRKNY